MAEFRLPQWMPQGRNAGVLVTAMLVSSFGTGMFLAGSALFFTTTVGLSAVELGSGLAIASVVGLITSLPISSVADWAGPKRVLIILYCWRSLWFVVLAFVGGPIGFAVAASAQAAAQQCSTPILQALIGTVTDDKSRTSTMALIRSIRNVGFALGALVAAPLAVADDIWLNRGILIGTGATLLASGLVLLLLPSAIPKGGVASRNPFAGLRSISDLRYLGLAGANGILALHMTMLAVGIPLWLVSLPNVSNAIAPLIVFINTVIVIVAQVPFSRGVDDIGGAVRVVWYAGAALAACCLALMASGLVEGAVSGVVLIVIAGLLLTCGELWHSVGSWELSFSLAPETSRSSHLAVFSLGVTAQDALGPLLIGGLVIANGAAGWLGLALFFMVGAFATTAAARQLARHRGVAEPVPA